MYFNSITRAIRERAVSNKFDPTSGTSASLDGRDFASQTPAIVTRRNER